MRIPTLAVTLAAAAAVVALPTAANAAAPVAGNDSAQVSLNTPKDINVLANDTDADAGTTLTITGKTNGSHGTVVCGTQAAPNVCTYTPANGWVGGDTFTYTVTDGTTPVTATVTVETAISMITLSSTPANLVAKDDPKNPTAPATLALRNPSHKITGLVTGPNSVPAPGVTVQLYKRTSVEVGTPKVAVGAPVTSGADGKIEVSGLQPNQKTYYSWKSVAGKNSAERSVTVTPFLTTKFGDGSFNKGGSFTPTATAGPVSAGQQIVLQRKTATGWTAVETKQFGTPAADNSASVEFAPVTQPDSGSFVYRIVVPQDNTLGREKATSGTKTINVYSAQVLGVQPSNADEYVTIKNNGLVSINLKNWQLSGGSANLTLPRRSVAPNGVVKVHTFKGTNDSKNLYLGRANPVWGNNGTATLKDNAATPVTVGSLTYP